MRVGDEERFVSLGEQGQHRHPALRQPARREDQHYPAGADRAEERQRRLHAEKLGIGLVSLKVEAASPSS
ncbi:hypothetical protein M8494_05545 [Serratia ureilytica]